MAVLGKNVILHFFDGRIVHAWKYGATSWSIENKRDIISWPYAKLAEV